MSDGSQVARKEREAVERPPTAVEEAVLTPRVDIYETPEALRLIADMPGADQKDVDVTVENNVLSVHGKAMMERPEGYHLTSQEFEAACYRREFELSERVDPAGIKARVRHGVLEVTLPKREPAKARKIEITA
jgi:HSP20 family molecular chaperone IbpA